MENNSNKKCLHICTIDKGGAYNGACRLNEMLTRHGMDSKILVRTKTDKDSAAICAFNSPVSKALSKMKNAINLIYKKGDVKRDICGTDLRNNKYVKDADYIFIHWISTFLSPKQIYQLSKLKDKKIIFWMHDMWLFTGGCHVDRRCGGYIRGCIDCPIAGNYAGSSFKRKKGFIEKSDLTIVGPSRWIVEEAKKSAILKGKNPEYIPNTFNTGVFHIGTDKNRLREQYGFSKDKKIILFGAADLGTGNADKGFKYLLHALKKIDMDDKQLVVMGAAKGAEELLKDYDAVFTGYIRDENKLADIYRAADVFVNPSLQESFGYTVCESMACGTPAVAFAVGGMLDQIEHKKNGYLAEFKNGDDIAEGIEYCLDDHDRLSESAALSAKRFSYDNVYEQISTVLLN